MRITTLALLAIFITLPAFAAERTVTLNVENMTCALCPITVSKAISSVSGVSKVEISIDDATATVVFDDAEANIEAIADASTFAGYPASEAQ